MPVQEFGVICIGVADDMVYPGRQFILVVDGQNGAFVEATESEAELLRLMRYVFYV